MNIPKIIHQIWFQGVDKIKQEHLDNIHSVKRNHPGWTHILWDEEKMLPVVKTNPIWLETWNRLDYIVQKCDLFRYIILYLIGGVYLDIDVFVIRPLDNFINTNKRYQMIISRLNIDYLSRMVTCGTQICVNNSVIFSAKGAPALIDLLNNIYEATKNKCNMGKFYCVTRITGPTIFTKVLSKYDDIKIVDSSYFDSCTQHNCNIGQDSYIIDKHDESWIGDELKNTIDKPNKIKSSDIYLYVLSILKIVVIVSMSVYFTLKFRTCK